MLHTIIKHSATAIIITQFFNYSVPLYPGYLEILPKKNHILKQPLPLQLIAARHYYESEQWLQHDNPGNSLKNIEQFFDLFIIGGLLSISKNPVKEQSYLRASEPDRKRRLLFYTWLVDDIKATEKYLKRLNKNYLSCEISIRLDGSYKELEDYIKSNKGHQLKKLEIAFNNRLKRSYFPCITKYYKNFLNTLFRLSISDQFYDFYADMLFIASNNQLNMIADLVHSIQTEALFLMEDTYFGNLLLNNFVYSSLDADEEKSNFLLQKLEIMLDALHLHHKIIYEILNPNKVIEILLNLKVDIRVILKFLRKQFEDNNMRIDYICSSSIEFLKDLCIKSHISKSIVIEFVRYVLSRKCIPEQCKREIIKYKKIIKLLLKIFKKKIPTIDLINYGSEIIKIRNGLLETKKNITPLYLALEAKSLPLVEILIKYRAYDKKSLKILFENIKAESNCAKKEALNDIEKLLKKNFIAAGQEVKYVACKIKYYNKPSTV